MTIMVGQNAEEVTVADRSRHGQTGRGVGARVHSKSSRTVMTPGFSPAKIRAMADRGHQIGPTEETFSTGYFGRPKAILFGPRDRLIRGGVNQYKPAMAIGL